MITIRYESKNYFTRPFELGIRHLQLAICNGSQDTLIHLAKERIVCRPSAPENLYPSLSIYQRAYHITLGFLEISSSFSLFTRILVAEVDSFVNKPWYPMGGPMFKTHIEEGGEFHEKISNWRKNPFNNSHIQDPFFKDASWNQK